MQGVSMSQTFLSKNRNYSTTCEDLSERWGLSISQAALTLKVTTQKLTIYVLMLMAQTYRADLVFDICGIHGTMSTNTMDARFQSIHNEKYCQLFGNKIIFVEAYPIKKKYDCRLELDNFIKEYGAPDKMTYDGAL